MFAKGFVVNTEAGDRIHVTFGGDEKVVPGSYNRLCFPEGLEWVDLDAFSIDTFDAKLFSEMVKEDMELLRETYDPDVHDFYFVYYKERG